MAELVLEGIHKTYPGRRPVTAVQPVDLVVRDGEFLSILGPSGCGKTTLLHLISGLVPPTGGRVLLEGRDITWADPKDRDMAMVFQNYALYPAKTVRGNLEFPLRMMGVPKAERERRVQEVAASLGLTELLDHFPRQLSGGQQQRVALGRALIRRPKVFLMDEPLSNLDAILRVHMRAEIKRLHRMFPATTIYVTHDQAEAMTLSDRIVVMDKGRIIQIGTPDEIFQRPRHRFVAGFVGTPPMNLIPVELEPAAQGWVCRLADGQALCALPGRDLGRERRRALFGVRPQHLRWTARPDAAEGWLAATVDEVDALGDDAQIRVRIGAVELLLLDRTGARPAPGEVIGVGLEGAPCHLFDPQSEEALLPEPVRAAPCLKAPV